MNFDYYKQRRLDSYCDKIVSEAKQDLNLLPKDLEIHFLNETYYGKNPTLLEIEGLIDGLKSYKNPNKALEKSKIEDKLADLFGFEDAHLTFIPNNDNMNACTMPIYWEDKCPEKENFKVVKTSNGIKFKHPEDKHLYIYVNHYTLKNYKSNEVVSIILHEVGHNFFNVEDWYLYLRQNYINSRVVTIILSITSIAMIPYAIVALYDLYQFSKSPQKYTDQQMKATLKNYEKKAKEPGIVYKALTKLFALIGEPINAALSPLAVLGNFMTVIMNKLFYSWYKEDDYSYEGEKFSDNFAATYGYAVEVANVFSNTNKAKLSRDRSLINEMPVIRLLSAYNDSVYNCLNFFFDAHPDHQSRVEMMLKKLKYELRENSDTLTKSQKDAIQSQIYELERIVKESNEKRGFFEKFFQDTCGMRSLKDKMSHENIDEEDIYDFEKKMYEKTGHLD